LTPPVQLSKDGAIAVIRMDSPPVNALGHALRSGLYDALKQASDDTSVEAIVVGSSNAAFSGGADITEFGKPPRDPSLVDIINVLDAMTKPTVAAIGGVALGGGLEFALGFHFRIASSKAQLGLPEVKLGILPGAQGTQRLPRVIGVMDALRLIVTGDMIRADKALSSGLVDAIAQGDVIAEAVAFARKAVAEKLPLISTKSRDDKLNYDEAKFNVLAGELTKRARGLEAPIACAQSVRNAATMPFEEGVKAEREIFMKLVTSDQSKAQRHLFFAERAAKKVPDMPADAKARKIDSVTVLGAGTMGRGIAMSFADSGIPATIVDMSEEALAKGLADVENTYKQGAARGRMSEDEAKKRIGLVKGTTNFEDGVKNADMVIEAVFEEMALKKKIFADLDKYTKPGAILASNTSTLDVDQIASATSRPGDVLGMHFFSPANVMKLLEIVRGEKTSHEALKTAMDIGSRIKKVGVISGVCYGFIGNRMLGKRSTETERLLLEGALPQEIDGAVTEFGFPMGPCAMGDLAGLDVGWRIRKELGTRAAITDKLCELGRFGQKTGRGYYIYEAGSRVPRPDPEVEQIILETAKEKGIERRPISKEEIVERMVYPMINEGARILDEGIAMRPGDIDVVWIYGYGWPVARGGPMFYADQVGLARIAERLGAYAEQEKDDSLKPASLLAKLAAEGKGFSSFSA
jgi:3-hydroxyacyl-CoA dehydrogenase